MNCTTALTRRATPVATAVAMAIALALLGGAGAAQAQVRNITDGTSNTVLFGDGSVRNLTPVRGSAEPAGATLTTRANVSGNITQTNSNFSVFSGNQIVGVGGVRNANALAGTIETQGTVTGAVSQTRAKDGLSTQTLNVGGVDGSLTVNGTARLTGVVQAAVTQSIDALGNGNAGAQTIDVGGAGNFNGNSLTTLGLVTGALTQTQPGGITQVVRVAGASGQVLDANLTGTALSTVQQSSRTVAGDASDQQRVEVGSLQGAQAQSVVTNGLLGGALTQNQAQGSVQVVEIGAVSGIDAAGRITTLGTATGAITQQSNGLASQRLAVGSVRGGSPQQADAKGVLSGSLTQTNAATDRSPQAVLIGSIDNTSGRARTDATVTGNITQTLGAVARNNNQQLSVGSAGATGGDVTTRAVLNGNVSQTSLGEGVRQTINVGSAVRTRATVRTDVTVTGNLTQTSASTSVAQTILLGGVIGASNETLGNGGTSTQQ